MSPWAQVMAKIRLRRSGHQPGEHIDDGVGQERAERPCLAERRHEEGAAAGAPKRWRSLIHAESVSVCLDHGGAFGGARKVAQVAVVRGKRAEIDGEEGGVAGMAFRLARSARHAR